MIFFGLQVVRELYLYLYLPAWMLVLKLRICSVVKLIRYVRFFGKPIQNCITHYLKTNPCNKVYH